MSLVYWNSMLFVYWLESHPEYGPRVDSILSSIRQRGDTLVTGYLALGETLTMPIRMGDAALAGAIERFFDSGRVGVLPFDRGATAQYARLRAAYRIAPADAIHLATAASTGVDIFVTNDLTLQKLQIPGLRFIVGLNSSLF